MSKQIPKIRFKEFTDEWEQRKLGELADIVGGGTPSTTNADYWNGDIDWYAPAEIGNQIFINKSKKKITKLGLEKSSAKILPIGTVLFTSRAGIGNTAILAKEGTTNQGFQSIVPNKNILDSYFIFSRSHELKRYGEVVGAGSTFIEVSGKQMAKMPMLIPEIKEQSKIGNIFKQLDNTITLHQDAIQRQQDLKKAMLQKLFPINGGTIPTVRFASFTEEWEQRKLGEVFDVHTDFVANGSFKSLKENVKYFNTENYAYMIRLQDASNNWSGPWIYTDKQGYDFLKKSSLNPGDILMSDRGTIGKFFQVPKLDRPMTLSSNAVLLRSSKHDNSFLFVLMSSNQVANDIKVKTTPGVQPMISKTAFKTIITKLPSSDEQKKIGELFSVLDSTIALHQQALEKLKLLKKSLLQKMFI